MATKKPKTWAEKLRDAIAKDGRAPTAIAHAAGISHPIMSRFLSGKRSLTLETAEKIAKVVGLDLNLGE